MIPELQGNKAFLAITANTEGTRAFLLSAYAQSYKELTENAE
ncbi:hypothetical protein AHIS2_p011 [Acaryochloris phage A-HIS2]|nr:hypothetical protein AHIS2_p011 [Acaryochloris phage A-HIS2]